ncbi:hypothetical protein ACIBW9_08470 [Streptomyces sp. NPDC049541]|uniref:hypothetical protein n=1 Tax=Streptomyces sp. NPDC049541 TaxID=3365594 RepID=UPI0037AAC56B
MVQAARAQQQWAALPYVERAQVLRRAGAQRAAEADHGGLAVGERAYELARGPSVPACDGRLPNGRGPRCRSAPVAGIRNTIVMAHHPLPGNGRGHAVLAVPAPTC